VLYRQQRLPQVEKASKDRKDREKEAAEEKDEEKKGEIYSKSRLSLEATDFSAIAFDSFG